MSGIFLKDGARVVGARSGLLDDFAWRTVEVAAQKVFFIASRKFSRTKVITQDREFSAWDIYCRGCARIGGSFRDKLISDFIRLSLIRWIDDMSDEMRWLIEMSACSSADVEEDELVSREIVMTVIQAEVNRLVVDHGRSLQAFRTGCATPHQPIRNGASPA